MFLIDANIFLEVELDQERADECATFLQKVKEGVIEALVTDFTVDGIALVIERHGRPPADIKNFLEGISVYRGLTVYHVRFAEKLQVPKLMVTHGLGYEDSIQLQAMLSNQITEVVSLDRHFDRVKGIRRLEPAQAAGKVG